MEHKVSRKASPQRTAGFARSLFNREIGYGTAWRVRKACDRFCEERGISQDVTADWDYDLIAQVVDAMNSPTGDGRVRDRLPKEFRE